jgi:hypothetical protein
MAVNVQQQNITTYRDENGRLLRWTKLVITGLAAGANTVPHGLIGVAVAPWLATLDPASAGGFHQTQAADSTNLYISADGSGTAVDAIVWY